MGDPTNEKLAPDDDAPSQETAPSPEEPPSDKDHSPDDVDEMAAAMLAEPQRSAEATASQQPSQQKGRKTKLTINEIFEELRRCGVHPSTAVLVRGKLLERNDLKKERDDLKQRLETVHQRFDELDPERPVLEQENTTDDEDEDGSPGSTDFEVEDDEFETPPRSEDGKPHRLVLTGIVAATALVGVAMGALIVMLVTPTSRPMPLPSTNTESAPTPSIDMNQLKREIRSALAESLEDREPDGLPNRLADRLSQGITLPPADSTSVKLTDDEIKTISKQVGAALAADPEIRQLVGGKPEEAMKLNNQEIESIAARVAKATANHPDLAQKLNTMVGKPPTGSDSAKQVSDLLKLRDDLAADRKAFLESTGLKKSELAMVLAEIIAQDKFRAQLREVISELTPSPVRTDDEPRDVVVVVTNSNRMHAEKVLPAVNRLAHELLLQPDDQGKFRFGFYSVRTDELDKHIRLQNGERGRLEKFSPEQLSVTRPSTDVAESLGSKVASQLLGEFREDRPNRRTILVATTQLDPPRPDEEGWKSFQGVDVVLIRTNPNDSVKSIPQWLEFTSAKQGTLTVLTADQADAQLGEILYQRLRDLTGT